MKTIHKVKQERQSHKQDDDGHGWLNIHNITLSIEFFHKERRRITLNLRKNALRVFNYDAFNDIGNIFTTIRYGF